MQTNVEKMRKPRKLDKEALPSKDKSTDRKRKVERTNKRVDHESLS